MTETRIQFNNIIQNQLPAYVREEFPLVAEFLKQYYISQEFQGASTDLIQNIDQYLKLDTIKTNTGYTTLTNDISFLDETIPVSSTVGFPDSYGLLQIDDEIITYTSKTEYSFTGCVRGFSGVTSYNTQNKPDELLFKTSESSNHSKENTDGTDKNVINLSSLFLGEFFNKVKYQLVPGFENREFYSGLDKYLFLKQSKDFYSTRGTDLSFKILFKVLYGEDVKIIKPKDYLIKPSDAQYTIVNELVVETISGNPYELENSTLEQDAYGDYTFGGYAPVTSVEKVFAQSGKIYYKLSIDAGYNRDIRVDGSIYGNFSITPKTKLIGEVSPNSTTLDVDSTVGFPSQGQLSVVYSNGIEGLISYSSKNINQFFGCQNITGTIPDQSDIWLNVFAYGNSNRNTGEIIKVRITSVLNNVDVVDDTYYYNKDNIGIIRTLGSDSKDVRTKNWFLNISTDNEVSSISSLGGEKYRVTTVDDNILRVGDDITLFVSDGTEVKTIVDTVISSKIFTITWQGTLDLGKKYSFRRNLSKVNSSKYVSLKNELANVQNIYNIGEKTLVASPSLPFFKDFKDQPLEFFDKEIIFSGTFVGDTFDIGEHNFYTGDAVYYTPGTVSLFDSGVYFVKRISPTSIKLAKSRANLYKNYSDGETSVYVSLDSPVESENNKIQDYDFYNKSVKSQRLLREIDNPIDDGIEHPTNPGTIGILVNGVEILNYKSRDKIYYGPLDQIDVINSGTGYDIINPPSLLISDSVGVGATGYCSVKGSLQEIRIIDPGFDYLETPKINITGGNGKDAKASASMKLIDHTVLFNSESKSEFVNLTDNTIGFSTYHKFRNSEKVIYKTEGQTAVGGITTNSSYYVSVLNSYTIKLHNTYNDSLSGINTVNLTSYGIGNHIFESETKKSVVASINIENSGFNYENKKRTTNSAGISTSLSKVEIKNHDFNSGEIIKYSTTGTPIEPLVNNQKYYVTKIDEDNFKLSLVGIGSDNQDFFYITNQYIDFTSVGSGTHTFNYPEISVEVVGGVGISSTNGNTFTAKVQPIFRGEITSIHLENNGVGYGSSEIINFDREPNIDLISGSNAQVIPVINNGKIVEILVNNIGSGYNSPPNLTILTNGSGSGAVLTPIVEDGVLKDVKIIESGYGYDKNNTFIVINSAGTASKLKAKIKSWTINLVSKYLEYPDSKRTVKDDGIVFYNPNSKYELQYAHLYAPRKLRENLFSLDSSGKILYGKSDLIKSNNSEEISSTNHSPIIGWAYDGNPIYGPYGYSNKNGTGPITGMKSGYKTVSQQPNRPPFPSGFFVEDFEYQNSDDEKVLDEYNGRFCVTPDFPNGTYAYFATVEDLPLANFSGYKLPVFPYFIGDKFKSTPNKFNFDRKSNQDDINLNETKWARNTLSFNLTKQKSSYSYLTLPNLLNQTVDIKSTSLGKVESVGIITGGLNYKVNDIVVLDEIGSGGFGFSSKVSRIDGKQVNSISVATTAVYDVEIYTQSENTGLFIVQSSSPHNFSNKDTVLISGLSTESNIEQGLYNVGVSSNTFVISNPSGIGNVSSTGITTYISVSGNIAFSNVKENDIYKVGNEKVKILNIDRLSSRIRVLRSVDGTVGSSHSYSDIMYEIPRRFSVNIGVATSYDYKINREIYFDPKESLGIGTNIAVGAGVTLTFSNPGVGITQVFVPTKTIYLPNHNLNTGDVLTYNKNGGNEISVSIDGINLSSLPDNSKVYVAKISNNFIGISTVKVGLGSTGTFVGIASTTSSSTTLYFNQVGTGNYHSFKTNYDRLSGQVSKNTVTVSTAQTHGLLNGDYVFVNVNPGISKTVVVKYDDYSRKVLIDPKNFLPSDVNSLSNTITIQNHGFETGQKVSYGSTSSFGQLVKDKTYYVVVHDRNNIKLSTSYYDATNKNPITIGISSLSSGVISLVNPPIKVYKNSQLVFDLSDSSLSYLSQSTRYSAFELNLYSDSNFIKNFDSSSITKDFEIQKIGQVGIDSSARVLVSINSNIPQTLFYKLNPIYSDKLPTTKLEIVEDSDVFANNQIQVLNSLYNGKYPIVSTSSTSFTYLLSLVPESPSYDPTISKINYETSSLNAFGPISKVDILSKGQNYSSLPYFSKVISNYGSGTLLELSSSSIGKIQKTRITDIGFDFPTDLTVRPNLGFSQILKIDPLNSFEFIGVSSVGRGYSIAPKLVVLDGKTKELLSEVDLKYSLGDTFVTILNNSYRLNNIDPIIIPTQNSNGVGISSISYNQSNNDVTVTLSVGFSTAASFPFSVDDKVLIENVSVGINSTGKGFNSENYNYQLFTITATDPNIGGDFGSVTYNLGEFLSSGEIPGQFDAENSAGRIIPEKYFPKFKTTLSRNNFFKDEKVRYSSEGNSIGIVDEWNDKTKYLKVSSRETIDAGKIIEGLSSKTQGYIISSANFDAFINPGSYSRVEKGWAVDTGILNNNLQRVQDNFYYQNFSYSLNSRVPYDTWENAVGSLNHTAGFKKFSDYQLETKQICGINTDAISIVDATVNLDGFASFNCFYDFDLARENALVGEFGVISDEITFLSRSLIDYTESVSNRVLSIDDISGLFNSNPRLTRFSTIYRFPLTSARGQKYITYVKDKRFKSQKQLMIFTLLHDNSIGYLNQYGRVETSYDMGSFDFEVDQNEGVISFYPTKYRVNDYNIAFITYNIKDNFLGLGNTSLGGIVDIKTSNVSIPFGSSSIVELAKTYTSVKILAQITGDSGQYQFDEINVIHDGSNVEIIDYGQLSNANSSSGLGTYSAYISGPNLKVDFTPNVGIAVSVSTMQVAFTNSTVSGIGTFDIKNARFQARSTSISASGSPTPSLISSYSNVYDGGYFIVQVSDITNNRHQLSEIVAVTNNTDSYFTEFANLETHSGLGTVGIVKNGANTELTFTPLPNIETRVKVYSNTLTDYDIINTETQYNNNTINSGYGVYYGTERDVRRSFELKHKGLPIFQRYFNPSNQSVVSIGSSIIRIDNHFFVTGEKVTYSTQNPLNPELSSPMGIVATDFGAGIGVTNSLPSSVYIIKVDQNNIKLAASAGDALKTTPNPLIFTSTGIGTNHSITSNKQNAKAIVAIDNVIQSPVVSTATTTILSESIFTIDDVLYLDSTNNLFIGDLLKINNEIMKVESVGVGSTNSVRVVRPWLGTELNDYTSGSLVTKIFGNYNIVDNIINFVDAPYGNVPLSSPTNPPDERDWTEISTNSSFQGRTFMRSGIQDEANESYSKNYIFDDISSEFSGSENTFTLKSNGSNVSDFYQDNAVILINEIFQGPQINNDYTLNENLGITSITFVGTATSLATDINTSNLPSGGIIVSIGSTEGFGYQPLVSAGGTAVVSIAGTISSISIGNSGSGYRSFIDTPSGIKGVVVRVGVATSSTNSPNIEFIGTATVSNGNIVSIAITNPGTGYTSTNPPYVFIDSPLSYSDIPLIYSSSSSGIGTRATIDVVVGQGSSVIDFEIKNTGYGYKVSEILTIPVGGATGIPTTPNSTLKEFQISIQKTFADKFSGWSLGELQIFDNIENLFNGRRVIFPLVYQGEQTAVYARRGSLINIQDVLLVFINDILQVPGEGYIFNGGSRIQFTEAPKPEDKCKIIFYKGSGDGVDVILRNVIETVKPGDDLSLTYDPSRGQSSYLLEDPRFVSDIISIDTVETIPYFGPGNTSDLTLSRPITWCRQTEDAIINEKFVSKNRMLYEPLVNPSSYLIQSVGIGSTIFYVDNLRPFFNAQNEASNLDFQKNITLISQDSVVSASATAVVSTSGTITSIVINNGGFGYEIAPEVTIQSPSGITTITSTSVASISSGIVTSISITGVVTGYSTSKPPLVLIEPPTPKVESNKVVSYSGDSGIIVGFGTTSIGPTNQIILDLFIPSDSSLRNNSLVGSSTTISSLTSGDFFMIYNSNVGIGTSAFVTLDQNENIIGSSTQFIDNICQVDKSEIIQKEVVGIGTTYVRRVFAKISGVGTINFSSENLTFDSTTFTFDNGSGSLSPVYTGTIYNSNYFGNYSWGRILLKSRTKNIEFNSYIKNGITGINTSAMVKRTASLKYTSYII